ncbi:hypothetical protein D3C76_1609490 [compost metagenome]
MAEDVQKAQLFSPLCADCRVYRRDALYDVQLLGSSAGVPGICRDGDIQKRFRPNADLAGYHLYGGHCGEGA